MNEDCILAQFRQPSALHRVFAAASQHFFGRPVNELQPRLNCFLVGMAKRVHLCINPERFQTSKLDVNGIGGIKRSRGAYLGFRLQRVNRATYSSLPVKQRALCLW